MLLAGMLAVLPAVAPRAEPPAGIMLQRVPAPDTDTIRWVSSRRSVTQVADLGADERLVRLERFGREVDYELREAVAGSQSLVLDLRSNAGGSLGRMLRVAARFIGPVPDAVRLIQPDGVRHMAIPSPDGAVWQGPIVVLVGSETRSSAEVLAALLRRFAGARLLGARTFGKDYALRVEPISQEWRALVPAGRIEVPGEPLTGGIVPDAPIPAALSARIPNR